MEIGNKVAAGAGGCVMSVCVGLLVSFIVGFGFVAGIYCGLKILMEID